MREKEKRREEKERLKFKHVWQFKLYQIGFGQSTFNVLIQMFIASLDLYQVVSEKYKIENKNYRKKEPLLTSTSCAFDDCFNYHLLFIKSPMLLSSSQLCSCCSLTHFHSLPSPSLSLSLFFIIKLNEKKALFLFTFIFIKIWKSLTKVSLHIQVYVREREEKN